MHIYIKNHKLASYLLAFTVFTLLCNCTQKQQEIQVPTTTQESNQNIVHLTPEQKSNMSLSFTQLATDTISSVIWVNGKAETPTESIVSITNPLGGYLKSTSLQIGMQVKKNQVIAYMQDPSYVTLQKDYLIAQDNYQLALKDYNRQVNLNKSQASSDKVLQQALNTLNNEKIQKNALAQQLHLININPSTLTYDNITHTIAIYSPINGYVSKTFVNPGKYVTPTDILFELIDPNQVVLGFNIYEKDLPHLAIGQQITAYTTSSKNGYPAKITYIGKEINSQGFIKITCLLQDKKAIPAPGTYLTAQIKTSTYLAKVLPTDSVLYYDNQNFVFVQTNTDEFTFTPVEVGDTYGNFTEIKQSTDLQSKQIVLKGAYTLLMKLKNTPEEE